MWPGLVLGVDYLGEEFFITREGLNKEVFGVEYIVNILLCFCFIVKYKEVSILQWFEFIGFAYSKVADAVAGYSEHAR